jgi:hypothetical protein
MNFPTSIRVAGYRFKEFAEDAPDEAIRALAKALDLPMEDAETVDFVRQALRSAHTEIRSIILKDQLEELEKGHD